MKKLSIFLGGLLILSAPIFAQTSAKTLTAAQINENLTVTKDDIVVEKNSGKSTGTNTDGVNLYIRKKAGVNSVMLVETMKDPEGKRDNYAFRAQEYNSINGDEIRYLDGKKLESKYSKYSLISSTKTTHPALGDCFLIYIPKTMEWGYPWARNGTVNVEEGTFINIRTFEKKYGDYTGQWKDNPFMFTNPESISAFGETSSTVEKNVAAGWEETDIGLSDEYSQDTVDSFNEIADNGKGETVFSRGPRFLAKEISNLINKFANNYAVDLVFAIDTTGSMLDDLDALKNDWIPALISQKENFKSIRLGLLCYRDYTDDYNFDGLPVKIFEFTQDLEEFSDNLNSIFIKGNEGGDVPEAVYEALYASMEYFDWRKNSKKSIILIGDAEAHSSPKGSITKEMVYDMARDRNIELNCIIVPN